MLSFDAKMFDEPGLHVIQFGAIRTAIGKPNLNIGHISDEVEALILDVQARGKFARK